MIMPFGQYRDVEVEDVPTSYLEYVLREWTFRPGQEALQEEMDAQIQMRAGRGVVRKR